MKVRTKSNSMAVKLPQGNVLEVGTLNSISYLYVNGDNAEEAVTEYLEAHPELLGNDTLDTSILGHAGTDVDSYLTKEIILKRDGAKVSSVEGIRMYEEETDFVPSFSTDLATYSTAYLNEKFDSVTARVEGSKLIIG